MCAELAVSARAAPSSVRVKFTSANLTCPVLSCQPQVFEALGVWEFTSPCSEECPPGRHLAQCS